MSGVAIGGSGKLMSSTAIVTRMPGSSCANSGSQSMRMIQRIADRRLAIRQTLDRRIRIDHARADRKVFEDEVLAGRHDARRAIAIDVNDRFVRFAS